MVSVRARGHLSPALHSGDAMVRAPSLGAVPETGRSGMWGGEYPYHVELYVRPGWTYGAQDFGTVVGLHHIWGYPAYYEVVA